VLGAGVLQAGVRNEGASLGAPRAAEPGQRLRTNTNPVTKLHV